MNIIFGKQCLKSIYPTSLYFISFYYLIIYANVDLGTLIYQINEASWVESTDI